MNDILQSWQHPAGEERQEQEPNSGERAKKPASHPTRTRCTRASILLSNQRHDFFCTFQRIAFPRK